jgi:hypothetical protein
MGRLGAIFLGLFPRLRDRICEADAFGGERLVVIRLRLVPMHPCRAQRAGKNCSGRLKIGFIHLMHSHKRIERSLSHHGTGGLPEPCYPHLSGVSSRRPLPPMLCRGFSDARGSRTEGRACGLARVLKAPKYGR